MAGQSPFPKLFYEYYAIHETISAILTETNGDRLDKNYVAQRVREKHPELTMEPATLFEAINQAMNDVGVQQQ